LFFICHYCLRMFCQKELNCMYILPGYCNVVSCLWVSEPARPRVCVSSSSDDGLCQLSSSGSWTHTSHAQLPYGPSADHTNRTGTHVACSTYLHTLSLLSVYLRLLLLFCECCSRCRFQPYDCVIIRSIHLQILLMGMCQQCCSWSVAGLNHKKVIGRDPICASQHDMGLDLSENGSSETMHDEGDWNLAVR